MERAGSFLAGLWRHERGISSVEYALLLAFIGGGIILAANTLSTSISNEMDAAAKCIEGTDANCSF
ncbi:MAG: Flp family type IVb pilin [Kiloniellaceae bacterium]